MGGSYRRKKMIKKLSCLSLVFFVTMGLWAQGEDQSLSLEECILRALEYNLGVTAEYLSPQLADISVSQARERFLPQLNLNYLRQNTNSASFSWIEATTTVSTEYDSYYAQAAQEIPTGGSFTISLSFSKNDSNVKYQTINPRFGSTLSFNFTQPLLRNFGLKNARREIIIAKNNRDISGAQFKSVLLDTIYSVEEAYWNYVYSIENLRVRTQSLKLAQDLLVKNKREVEVGTLAPIEILSAEAEVATREADILQAEALVKDNENQLRAVINLMPEEKKDLDRIIPSDKPAFAQRELSLEDAMSAAMGNRPDLNEIRFDLKNKDMDLSYAKNQLLPDLSFRASYWSPGLSGTRLVYKDNNPLTDIIINTIEGKSTDAIKDALQLRYNNWAIGVTLEIPLNTIISRAELASARVSMDQAKLRLKELEQQIFLEVSAAVNSVQTDYKRAQAYEAARELADEKLAAEEKRLRVGLTTNYQVLQFQRDLANALGQELRAIVDYNLSSARLDRVLGTTFQSRNIKFKEVF
jgi:outer membrane protein TolC